METRKIPDNHKAKLLKNDYIRISGIFLILLIFMTGCRGYRCPVKDKDRNTVFLMHGISLGPGAGGWYVRKKYKIKYVVSAGCVITPTESWIMVTHNIRAYGRMVRLNGIHWAKRYSQDLDNQYLMEETLKKVMRQDSFVQKKEAKLLADSADPFYFVDQVLSDSICRISLSGANTGLSYYRLTYKFPDLKIIAREDSIIPSIRIPCDNCF